MPNADTKKPTPAQLADGLRLMHFSREPVTEVRSVRQSGKRGDKPDGFWLSIEGGEDGWSDWCKAEQWGIGPLAHEVTLRDDATILRLCGSADIDLFTRRYGIEHERLPNFYWAIDWPRIAEEYQGIIIAPYVWSRRLDGGANWYYSWDCASGCIWDASAVADICLSPSGLCAAAASGEKKQNDG